MKNMWKELWDKRTAELEKVLSGDDEQVFLELKRSNGFDVFDGKMNYSSFVFQLDLLEKELSFPNRELKSIYEVGCGSGANLYWFAHKIGGENCGGCDYSSGLINSAKAVLEPMKCPEIICCEAKEMDVERKYDAVFSNSVFFYFENLEYAKKVLELMLEKSNYSLGLLDIHDSEKKDDYIQYRKKNIEDYEKRYENLPKLFYQKSFFVDFAQEHNLDIKISASHVPGYWNNEFIFNVFLWKSEE